MLVQPFVSEINKGELAVIVIDGKVANVVRRFPGVFEGVFHVEVEDRSVLNDEIKAICKKICDAPEYAGFLYARIDLVKTKSGYCVMEVELFEPQLFYYLLKGAAREKMLMMMVSGVGKRMWSVKRGGVGEAGSADAVVGASGADVAGDFTGSGGADGVYPQI